MDISMRPLATRRVNRERIPAATANAAVSNLLRPCGDEGSQPTAMECREASSRARMTWRAAAAALGVTTPALHRWVRSGDPTWGHGKAILALAERLRANDHPAP